ncbi:hypothetical protein OG206_02270 [Streptomyces sp. NBC_01341]|nr:hypothetical protein OG206_02270 [Streptomyces sp. NBC_01341]
MAVIITGAACDPPDRRCGLGDPPARAERTRGDEPEVEATIH